MPRIPLVDPATAPEAVRSAFAAMPVHLGIFKLMANASESFRPLLRLGSSILAEQQLSAELREYAILMAVKSFVGSYEWVQHVPIAIACGATAEQVDAVEKGELGAACFSDKEKVYLAFVDRSIRDIRADDATFEAMAREFTPREIVETLLTIGYYQMLARLTECADLEPEAAVGMRVVDSARR